MEKIDYNKSSQTITTIVIGFLILHFASLNPILLYLSIAVGIAGLVSGKLANYIHWFWMKLAWVLSLIFPPILLSLIFFLFLTPIAWLSKIFSGKDLLRLKNSSDSTFIERNKEFEKADFEKIW